MTPALLRHRWVAALAAAVLIVCGVAATVWIVQYTGDNTASPEDCAIVAEVFSQWQEVDAAEDPLYAWANDPPGTVREDPPEIDNEPQAGIDRYLTLSANTRKAADAVSAPALQEDLNKWAEGFALVAHLRGSETNPKSMVEWSPEELAPYDQVGTLLYDTVPAMRLLCPNSLPQGS